MSGSRDRLWCKTHC